ncbi:fasciclin domain-containing protein [Halomonas organivorans]|uniref:Putative surface protein with fasciclin (FAS1) repeats n=1 Tax=Halomonas organivorans TaxID=257772 RepID=A0A7W5BXE3_9GAMM|nr:fasciclin domain-containing protein [Halomonas organivorans]MBB3140849.1 putative surface protein with fasciclin (FAS1) repeats [Halomonas organivorans]
MNTLNRFLCSFLCTAALAAGQAQADHGPTSVGGASMLPERNIVENAVNSADHETLVAAVQAAGLVDTLKGDGPFTVFAPVDAAFDRLPDGTVQSLLEPQNRDKLQALLTYHVVPGRLTSEDLHEAVMERGDAASFETVQGERLTVVPNGNNLMLMDAQGHSADITIVDVAQANGVIHVIDRVMMP